jgi:response regulator RpfG family c-di-GMP phosphodiesterase
MDEFFKWLITYPVATTVLIVVFVILVVSLLLIYLVAFFQGREISFIPPKIGAKPASVRKSNNKRVTVLIVDNDRQFLSSYKEFLEIEGFSVITAHNAAEARKALNGNDVDLAILDIRLANDDDEEDVSGLALAKAPAYHSIPKIILTAFPTPTITMEALKQETGSMSPNIVDFLSKSDGPDAMIASVKHALTYPPKR